MRPGGGKSKGSSFEREIAVGLSLWLSFGTNPSLLWRSAMSGGRATVWRDKKGELLNNMSGDLSAVHPDAHAFIDKFYCEGKSYKDLNYAGLASGTGHLVKFWQTTVSEANCYKKQPMLLAKQNRGPVVVFLQAKGLETLGLNHGQCVLIAPRLGAHGILFEEFLKAAKPI